jgi:hypothetical protein
VNQDEKIAEKFLKTCGATDFEPDGNIPPDFSLNKNIGVEVRRLNKNYRKNGSVIGLEEYSIPLIKHIENCLAKHPVQDPNERFWIKIRYAQNKTKKCEITKSIENAIAGFEASGHQCPSNYQITDTLELVFTAKASNTNQKYKLGMGLDRNRTGWVVNTYTTEINHCAQVKAQKVKRHENSYSQWWLLLIDHLGSINSVSHKEIITRIDKPSIFDRIVLVNTNSKKILEI